MGLASEFLREHNIPADKNRLGEHGYTFKDDEAGNLIITYAAIHGKSPLKSREERGAKDYSRIRFAPGNEPKDAKGKPIRYKTPYGSKSEIFLNGLTAFFGHRLHEVKRLFFVEGEKKAFVGCLQGVPMIGIQGIHNIVIEQKDALKKQLDVAFLPYLYEVFKLMPALKELVLVFDADCRTGSSPMRKASFASAVLKFQMACEKIPSLQDYWFSHIQDDFHEEAKGLDDLFLARKSELNTISEDLYSLNTKSAFFKVVNLKGTVQGLIRNYFMIDEIARKKSKLDTDFVRHCFYNNQWGDGSLLAKIMEGSYLFEHTREKWLIWRDGVWAAEDKIQLNPNLIVSHNMPDIYQLHLAGDATKQSEEENAADLQKLLAKRKQALKTWAQTTAISKYASGVLASQSTDFDADRLVLNLKNGCYNFETSEFQEHHFTDRFMKQAGANYDPNAGHPTEWMKFVNSVFQNDEGVIRFVQKWLGMCLTGSIDWQGFLYLYGGGRNGKSTFVNMVTELLGSYCVKIPTETLTKGRDNSKNEYQIAKMYGARLVVGSEVEKNMKVSESLMKTLTGGDEQMGRHIYGSPFTFVPTHKLCLFGNHKLIIQSQDEGIWRRVAMLPFNANFKGMEVKQSELMDNFRYHIDKVLMWAIKGFELYRMEGLVLPKAMEAAVNEYRIESDILAAFLVDVIQECKKGGKIPVQDVYTAYLLYCKNTEEEPILHNSRQMLANLKERGMDVKLYANKNYLMNARINENYNLPVHNLNTPF